MDNYANISDRQIEAIVVEKRYGMSTDKDIQKLFGEGKFSFCSNATEAFPIILENNIRLYIDDEYDDNGNIVKSCDAYNGNSHNSNTEFGKFNVHHENPLRAAMIVYLMMMGEE